MTKIYKIALSAVFSLTMIFLISGCGNSETNLATESKVSQKKESQPTSQKSLSAEPQIEEKESLLPEDATLLDFQNELIDLAFEMATKIPLEPHIKDRSRAQKIVVTATIQLDQPNRALKYAEQIKNWHKGAALAELAYYLAEKKITDPVEELLINAEEVAQNSEDWRRDRIHVKIGKAYVLLGEIDKADKMEDGIEQSEQGKLVQAKAKVSMTEDEFKKTVQEIDAIINHDKLNMDVVMNCLFGFASLYDSNYKFPDRRNLAEQRIKELWEPMPGFLRFELIMQLVNATLKNEDQEKAVQMVEEADQLFNSYKWKLEMYIDLGSQLIIARTKVGQIERAKADATKILAEFDEKREEIVNIYRARPLCLLAQAFAEMGDSKTALEVYKRAVENGFINPNSRPRAEDLSNTCVSMALSKIEPDEELWKRIRSINHNLGKPW